MLCQLADALLQLIVLAQHLIVSVFPETSLRLQSLDRRFRPRGRLGLQFGAIHVPMFAWRQALVDALDETIWKRLLALGARPVWKGCAPGGLFLIDGLV